MWYVQSTAHAVTMKAVTSACVMTASVVMALPHVITLMSVRRTLIFAILWQRVQIPKGAIDAIVTQDTKAMTHTVKVGCFK